MRHEQQWQRPDRGCAGLNGPPAERSGTVEVRDGETPLAVSGPGGVFGEMAFLLERPRAQDAYAATGGVRVLSLSEATLHQMITSDPVIAAHLLPNISTMLCLRLLKQR